VDRSDRKLWRSWVAANSIAEAIGLGGAFVLGDAVLSVYGEPTGRAALFAMSALVVAVGTLEGVVVGVAQGLVLHRPLPAIPPAMWIAATAVGAFSAWTLGLLPSVLLDLNQPGDVPAPVDTPQYLALVFAALLGIVAGPILAFAQWLVLRRHVARAWRWIPANAAAWMLGMPVVFVAPMLAHGLSATVARAMVFIATTAAAGAIVGAVHGTVLVRYLLTDFHVRRAPG